MKKQFTIIILISILLFSQNLVINKAYGAATVPLNITVNGSLVITDASNDTMAGKDPTINVNLSVTPDIGQTAVSGQANFRIRSNRNAWRLTTQRTTSNTGTTGLADTDVSVNVSTAAGSTANASAGTLVAPFNAPTTLASIPQISANVVNGTAKTSTAKDGTNTNNYFQINTSYSIQPDFFYTPGTFSTSITYNLVSP